MEQLVLSIRLWNHYVPRIGLYYYSFRFLSLQMYASHLHSVLAILFLDSG